MRAIGETETEAFGAEQDAPETPATFSPGEDAHQDAWDDEPPVVRRRVGPVIATTLALVLVAAWTGYFIWANLEAIMTGPSPQQVIAWAGQWALPVLLVATAWLIAMRSSAREATRFGNAARVLATEAAQLEQRLTVVNRELSLAREFLAAQSRDLDYVGRSAAERISEHASKLQALVVDNGAQVDAIAGVSATALANMSELRDNLPVIANSARDVTNQIGGAGRGAKAQLAELIAGFERLNDFGQASERQVESLRTRLDAMLHELSGFAETLDADNARRVDALRASFEDTEQQLNAREAEGEATVQRRIETVRAQLADAHDAARAQEEAGLTAMRARLAAFQKQAEESSEMLRTTERAALETWNHHVADLRERLETALAEVSELDRKALESSRAKLAELAEEAEAVDERLSQRDHEFQQRVLARQAMLESEETAALARLGALGAAHDSDLSARHAVQASRTEDIRLATEALSTRLAEIEAHADAIHARGIAAEKAMGRSTQHLASAVRDNAAELSATEGALARLTDASVRLLELIQASAQHSRTELPTAIAGFESQIGEAQAASDRVRATLDTAREAADAIGLRLGAFHAAGETAVGDLDALRERLTGTAEEQAAALSRLRQDLSAAHEENARLADSIANDLTAAIAKLREDGDAMLATIEHGREERIAAIAADIGARSGAIIERAMDARTGDTVRRLDTATTLASEATNETLARLRDQLARVHELTANIEARAARAREQVEEHNDSDFARRMALITESLNSHSIDIAKALSTEVTDTAWAAYLKGDRGVFTRRAIRLLGNGEAREVAGLYREDPDFRENVSRYINDFETMLRSILSTREGHAMGVTLLSSDMGKLYVALAQAIQRLRG